MILRSKFAPYLALGFSAVAYMYAAAPDFGFRLQGGWGIFVLLVLWMLAEGFHRLVHGTELDAYRSTFKQIGDVISSLSGVHSGGAAPQLLGDPDAAIDALLRRAKDLAISSLRPPVNCQIAANLLLPDSNTRGKLIGLRVANQDDYRPDRSHEPIPLDAPGAGVTFSTGEPQGIRSTDLEPHPRVQGKHYKSVGTFPIVVGEAGAGGRIVAVLSLDATVPGVFDQKAVDGLHPFVSPIAQLIGLALVTKSAERGDE